MTFDATPSIFIDLLLLENPSVEFAGRLWVNHNELAGHKE